MRGSFDGDKFYDALDTERLAKGINWKQVAEESGVSASSLTRMSQGKRPDVDTLAALLAWSGLKADQFMKAEPLKFGTSGPLPQISALLQADDALSHEATIALEEMIKSAYQRMKK
jgi:transcriptional regulator with XRE-family HTH domain